jgi:signal transduction histidine kinase
VIGAQNSKVQNQRTGSEVARSHETSVGRAAQLWSELWTPDIEQPPRRPFRRQCALAANTAGAIAVVILLAWANGRFSPPVALGLLAAVIAAFAAWWLPKFAQVERLRDEELAKARAQAAELARENAELHTQITTAYRRGSEINERSLRRIGADLHDGPAQLLGLVLLKIDELAPLLDETKGPEGGETLDLIRRAAKEALNEIRNTARGLVLPDIEQVSLASALSLAVKYHEQRTKSVVATDIGSLPAHVPLPITISLFRFAQEGLNNAFRHAGGKGQRLRAYHDGKAIVVEVADDGAGFDPASIGSTSDKLGLSGLKHRIEALGGDFSLLAQPGNGTRLSARFGRGFTA